tara:strand:+ start:261 stop:419 length:159 start_codon:yes stop_codon:yes gene_type:complete
LKKDKDYCSVSDSSIEADSDWVSMNCEMFAYVKDVIVCNEKVEVFRRASIDC